MTSHISNLLRRGAVVDSIVLLSLVLLAYGVFSYLDAFDEALILLALSGVGFGLFAFRRWGDLRRETAHREAAERRLDARERHFRALVENISDAVTVLDADGTVRYVSSAWEQVTGYSAEERAGRSAFERVHPDDLEEVREKFQQLVEDPGTRVEAQPRLHHKSGQWRTVRLIGQNLLDEPVVGGIVITYSDVTERVRAEEALHESEKRYRQLFERSPIGVYRSTPSGEIVEANPTMVQILGYSSLEELKTRDVAEYGYAAPEDRHRFLACMERDGEVTGFETVWLRRDGTLLYVRENSRPVRTEDGTIRYFEGTVEDISERVRVEEALRESEERFRALTEQAADFVKIIDRAGIIRYDSPSVERVLGYSPGEMIGMSVFSLVHPDDHPMAIATFEQALDAPGDILSGELRYRHEDGRWRVLHVQVRNLLDHPAVRGIVVNSRDVTEQRELEERLRQAQKMEAVGKLAGGVAHEFNNLLTAMKGHSHLLLNDLPARDPLRAEAEEIDRAADRAAELTNQLLAFGRKQIRRPRALDLNAAVARLEPVLRRLMGEDVEVSISLSPETSMVDADPGQLEQVIVNLVLNAGEATPSGGQVTIDVSTVDRMTRTDQADLASGRYVLLSVSDTGTGMAPEVRERVFEPFFTTREQGKGTGLGLSTVYGIVKQAGGDITVESAPSHGSTFRVYLPARDPSPLAGETPAARSDISGSNVILVVEDETNVRALTRRVLERGGYAVLEAENGREALRIFLEHPQAIDLVVTDVVMPEMDGRRLVERLRTERPDLAVIYMSGYTEDEVVRRGVARGDPFLAKPFSPADLVRKVRETLTAL